MKKILMILLIVFTGCSTKKEKLIEPFIVRVELNVCEAPFNAIPNDSLSDVASFRLAIDVLNNLTFPETLKYVKVEPVLIIPVGHYIIDGNMEWGKAAVRIRNPQISILGIEGSNISISGGTFIME